MMREVQINKKLKLREDGKLFNIRTGEEFIPSISSNGYFQVRFDGHPRMIHQLVMEYFGEPSPGPEYEIDHHNQNKLDNDINNLRWVTHTENMNNTRNNLPAGQRKCDFEDPKEYHAVQNRNWYLKNKEQKIQRQREYRKKKKEGG